MLNQKDIIVKDRRTGLLVKENIPKYIQITIKGRLSVQCDELTPSRVGSH